MRVKFEIEYKTSWGQQMYVCGSHKKLGKWKQEDAVPMSYVPGGIWQLEIDLPAGSDYEYKYYLKDEGSGVVFWETGDDRKVSIPKGKKHTLVKDYWRAQGGSETTFNSAAFAKNIFKRKKPGSKKIEEYNIQFKLTAPRLNPDYVFCVIGSIKELGKWNEKKAILMDDDDYPIWTAKVNITDLSQEFEYKFGIYNKKDKKFLEMEYGDNRGLYSKGKDGDEDLIVITDRNFRYPQGNWRGAGVAIPVFSLRSKSSWGVGEFLDLKPLIDWSDQTGLKLVQILPINDTVATHRWMDSYPYAAISVFALHPIYANMEHIGELADKKVMERYRKDAAKLNEKEELDYESVMVLKSKYYKEIWDQTKEKFLKTKAFKDFYKENEDWLVPYAVFSCLRDRYKTPEFVSWPEYSTYDRDAVFKFADPKSPDYDDVAVHYFIQFHLDKQLKEVAEFARKKGVILKGDIPIGIYRHSVDAWVEPQLYHMDKQAGAPPDAYAIAGQNWRFPTYNWKVMAEDNYQWWRKRLSKMASYFDAYRIDHILGFFRIWEIPGDQVEGLMGRFNPAIPMNVEEMQYKGLHWDYNRFCKPYIKEYMLYEIFGDLKEEVEQHYLNKDYGSGHYWLKPEFDTQRKVADHMDTWHITDDFVAEKSERVKFGLYTLIGNVLFFEVPGSNGTEFHPKIGLHSTYSFRELDDGQKAVVDNIYIHYYYERQEGFWREQAMVKLPAIVNATDMLVCGEDLGMVPDCVPGVMDELGILSLNIQRMPKGTENEFGHPADAEYMSVVSPSCHDMSTIRGWWEEDHARTERFYHQVMGHHNQPPFYCEPWVCREIVVQHMYSPAMWAIFPIQDLVGMNPDLRWKKTQAEQINVPSNPEHYWKYRFHMDLEDLNKEKEFNQNVKEMVEMSGRNKPF